MAEHAVAPGSAEELAISRWLQAHESGWRPDFNSYVPGRRIKGDHFDVNFVGRIGVLNFDPKGKGERAQWSRTLDDPDGPPDVFPAGR